jgi:hypothetical protein
METDLVKLMISKSDEELREYVDQSDKYSAEIVVAAMDELGKRGRGLSEEEVNTVNEGLKKQRIVESQCAAESASFFLKFDKNAVDEPEAPEFFSQKAIYIFTIFFGVLFGSILMSINAANTPAKKGSVLIALFGVGYTIAQLWILSFLPRNSGLTIITSIVGAIIMNNYFWNRYIGKETKYRKKAIWVPLVIGVGLTVIFLFFIFLQMQ